MVRYTVFIVKRPPIFPWKEDYFPRGFAYKKDAEDCVKQVRQLGGEAKIK